MQIDRQPRARVPLEEMQIRRATPQDAARVAMVHVAAWRAGYAGLLPDSLLASLSVEERTTSWAGYLDGGALSRTLIAVSGETTLGFASIGPSRDDDAAPGTGELWALYTDPDQWGLGAGSALLASAANELQALGFSRASLWVLATNRRARRFYEWQGWRSDGASKVESRGDARLDEVRYVRADLSSTQGRSGH
ncbi:MAG: GNAT family N-acetyltransferase [Nocardioides sp.]